MTFPILGGNGAVAGYSIDNSLRLSRTDSAHLDRTPASAGNRRTFTISTWFKRGEFSAEPNQMIVGAGTSAPYFLINLLHSPENEQMEIQLNAGVATVGLRTNRLFRDVSAWYHVVLAVDTTNATADNRVRLYINGVEETSFATRNNPSLNFDCPYNNTVKHTVGDFPNGSNEFDGYLAEFHSIDGQALSPTDFGEFDEDSGIWKPIEYTGTYGTNGFYLDFENSGSLGADQSGNGNNFTPTNLASTDQTTDTPTNNFATLNPLNGIGTFSEGNVKYDTGTSGSRSSTSTMGVSSGKWYSEIKITSSNGNQFISVVSDAYNSLISGNRPYLFNDNVSYSGSNGNKWIDGTSTSYGASYTTNDIIGIALNLDDDEITFYKNGASQGTITTKTFDDNTNYLIAIGNGASGSSPIVELNTGNPSFSISSGNSDGNGYGNFEYAPPSGYLALCTQNLATELSPTIDDGSEYFNTVLYTGNGTDNHAITGVGFQPDWFWVKERSSTSEHRIFDSSRGASRRIEPNNTNAETLDTSNMKSFDSDGFTLGTSGSTNENGQTYVGWNWLANGGTTSSNTDGSITSTVQANTTAGFSIVTYTGNGTAGATIGHGLGVVPNVMIVKMRTDAGLNWEVYHSEVSSDPETDFLLLNQSSALQDANNRWNDTAPTSSVFTVGNGGGVNSSGKDYVAYLFNNVEGYSKFGTFKANSSSNGTFVYLGFRAKFIMVKNIESLGADQSYASWLMNDTVRSPRNNISLGDILTANNSYAEGTRGGNTSGSGIAGYDIYSNGFKGYSTSYEVNASTNDYVYMAFAENPFVTSTGIPVTAR